MGRFTPSKNKYKKIKQRNNLYASSDLRMLLLHIRQDVSAGHSKAAMGKLFVALRDTKVLNDEEIHNGMLRRESDGLL